MVEADLGVFFEVRKREARVRGRGDHFAHAMAVLRGSGVNVRVGLGVGARGCKMVDVVKGVREIQRQRLSTVDHQEKWMQFD